MYTILNIHENEQFKTAKVKHLFELSCSKCGSVYHTQKRKILEKIKHKKAINFCSRKCFNEYQTEQGTLTVQCKQCNQFFQKRKFETLKHSNHFCSSSCAATYNNTHKRTGTRRSKLEAYLEEQLQILFPDLEILFNDKTTINSELDIYIPSMKLAFELNGIFHYEPIFGEDKLNQIQNNDGNKFQKCQENQISLCIIDTSSQKRFTELSSKKYLDIIVSIIEQDTRLSLRELESN